MTHASILETTPLMPSSFFTVFTPTIPQKLTLSFRGEKKKDLPKLIES